MKKRVNKEKSFFRNSFLLTASNLTTGIIGFIFSIYLSKVLGAEGLGLYNLVMPIYNLFIALMSAGIVASISKVAAVFMQKGQYNNMKKTIKVVAVFNVTWALFVGILVFISAPFLSRYGINDIRAINGIRVVCPAMVFIAISNIFKGFFYGTSKIEVPAVIDILEKAMRILTVAILLFITHAQTIELMVTMAMTALCIGELQSLIALYIYYKYSIKKLPVTNEKTDSSVQLLFNVMIITLPLCLNGFLTNILGTLSTLIVPRRLIAAGFDYTTALSTIGKYNGMAMQIIGIPMIIVSTINTLLIPDLSQTMERGGSYDAACRIHKVMKLAFLLGLATAVVCNIIPKQLGEMFFQRNDLCSYIKFASLACPLVFTSQTMFGILNGLNRQGIILRNSMIEATVELVGLFVLTSIPSINIYGYTITMFMACSISLCLNLYEVNKHIELDLNKYNIIFFALLAILVYLLISIVSKHLSCYFPIFNVIFVIGSVLLMFIYISGFGNKESY